MASGAVIFGIFLIIAIFIIIFVIILVAVRDNKDNNTTTNEMTNEVTNEVTNGVTSTLKETSTIDLENTKLVKITEKVEETPKISVEVFELASEPDSDHLDNIDLTSLISDNSENSSSYIDVVEFNDDILYLLEDVILIKNYSCPGQVGTRYVSHNTTIKRLIPLKGRLLSHDFNEIFILDESDYSKNVWTWKRTNLPRNIKNITFPRDQMCLFIQTHDKIFEVDDDILEIKLNPNLKRIYGNNKFSFLDLDISNNKIYNRADVIEENVTDAIITSNGELAMTSKSDERLLYIQNQIIVLHS